MHIVQLRSNNCGRFVELSNYRDNGHRTSAVIPEGRDGRGWASCLTQLSRLEAYFEKIEDGGRIDGKKHDNSTVVTRLVEQGEMSYAVALLGQG